MQLRFRGVAQCPPCPWLRPEPRRRFAHHPLAQNFPPCLQGPLDAAPGGVRRHWGTDGSCRCDLTSC
uniref:Uncharacterized protein n=1 Tax=Tetraselmis sp. GSL018 TaxID=582737 RepID=A0A061RS06_9CHLO